MSEITFPSTVDELRRGLLDMGLDPSEVASMKKSDLKEQYMNMVNINLLHNTKLDNGFGLCDLDKSQPIEEGDAVQTLEGAIDCKYGSEKWNHYVMGLFQAEELMDGYPKINGLRRVANLVLGDIVSSKATQVVVSHGELKSVTINYELQIEWKLNIPLGFGNLTYLPQTRVFGGVADCNEDLSSMFGRHSSATAESKAEGRALRKALCINVIAAEEMLTGSAEDSSPRAKSGSPISGPLKSVIEAKVDALKLSLKDVIKEWGSDKELGAFSMEEARDLFAFINKYQQGK